MGTPITEYREVRKCFPDESGLPLLSGEMHVYLIGEVPEAVNFLCPCGCGNKTYTPVTVGVKEEHSWLFSRGPNGPTLYPSIRWTGGCKAHFNITDGKVIVHGDSGK